MLSLAHLPPSRPGLPLLAASLLLALAAGCDPATPSDPRGDRRDAAARPSATWWLDDPEAAALEPHATVDASGRTWVAAIRFEEGRPRLQLAVGAGDEPEQTALLRPGAEWCATPRVAPLGGGVLCVWEEGDLDGGRRRLAAVAFELEGDRLTEGPSELVLEGLVDSPTLVASGPDRVELVACRRALPGGDRELVHLVREGGSWSEARVVAAGPGDAWAPDAVADGAGRVHVAWDRFDGERFGVEYAVLTGGRVLGHTRLASPAGYAANPSVAVEPGGAAWLAWEEAPQFGQLGGLRGERTLALARVEAGVVRWAALESLPDERLRCDFPRALWQDGGLIVTLRGLGPSFAANQRTRATERVDASGLPAATPRSRVYLDPRARFYTTFRSRVLTFDARGEPELFELPETEGDNHASETLLASPRGPRLVFAADLRSAVEPRPNPFEDAIEARGRVGLLPLPAPTGTPALIDVPTTRSPALDVRPARELRAAFEEAEPHARFGDLHRHTSASRCAGAGDGTATDVYRYARGPGALDFVAITDHFQHLVPWSFWRNQRDVARHHAPGRLVVFSGVERASPSRGHRNDVYLDPTAVSYDPPAWNRYPEVGSEWSPPAAETLSIPHMMGRSESPWRWRWFRPDLHRLFEVYQGARGSYEGLGLPLAADDLDVRRAGVGEGYADGRHFGLVASSDHGASSAGLAGVHAETLDRAAVFEALRARRAFAAVDFAVVDASIGPLAMGDSGTAPADAPLRLRARGPAPVAAVAVFKNGRRWRKLRGGEGMRELVVLTTRRWGPYPDRPMQLELDGAELRAHRARRRGELDVRVTPLADGRGLTLSKDREPLDLVLELDPLAAGAELTLSTGEDRTTVRLDDLEPDRPRRLAAPFDREQLWRIGPSLSAETFDREFDDPERRPGDSYFARVVFEDGNVAWTSPVRVSAFGDGTDER